jgi:UDP-glucose 6-dehydrogenase
MSLVLRLTVLGAGYLGITHAACMASLGFDVLGVDTDALDVAQILAGMGARVTVYDPAALGNARRVRPNSPTPAASPRAPGVHT